jgi:hypothetical protein
MERPEHNRVQCVREARRELAILGQHPGRQGEHQVEARRSGLDLTHPHAPPGRGAGIIHPAIMPLQRAFLPAANPVNLADLLRGIPGLNVSIMRAVSRSERIVTRCR